MTIWVALIGQDGNELNPDVALGYKRLPYAKHLRWPDCGNDWGRVEAAVFYDSESGGKVVPPFAIHFSRGVTLTKSMIAHADLSDVVIRDPDHREPGFYWVRRYDEEPEIAAWHAQVREWRFCDGNTIWVEDAPDAVRVLSGRLEPPGV